MTNTVSPPFRIERIKGQAPPTEENQNQPPPPPQVQQHERMLVGSAPNNWVCTFAQDFSTFTFAGVYKLFRSTVCDLRRNSLLVNRLVCNVPTPQQFQFSAQSMKVLTEENAGGASEFSEAVSFEMFQRCFQARLVKTEMQIEYFFGNYSKKTDYLCQMFEQENQENSRFAVSVTRAMKFQGVFTEKDAFNLLYKKLLGVQLSNRDVMACDRWNKQVLHVMTEHVYIVDLLRSVFSWMYERTPELVGDTVVLITLTVNCPFLYFNFCAEQAQMQFHATDTPDFATAAAARVQANSVDCTAFEHVCVTRATANTTVAPAKFLLQSFYGDDEEDDSMCIDFDSDWGEGYTGARSIGTYGGLGGLGVGGVGLGCTGRGAGQPSTFFYGYPTLAEATLHGALPILHVGPNEEMWDEEGMKEAPAMEMPLSIAAAQMQVNAAAAVQKEGAASRKRRLRDLPSRRHHQHRESQQRQWSRCRSQGSQEVRNHRSPNGICLLRAQDSSPRYYELNEEYDSEGEMGSMKAKRFSSADEEEEADFAVVATTTPTQQSAPKDSRLD